MAREPTAEGGSTTALVPAAPAELRVTVVGADVGQGPYREARLPGTLVLAYGPSRRALSARELWLVVGAVSIFSLAGEVALVTAILGFTAREVLRSRRAPALPLELAIDAQALHVPGAPALPLGTSVASRSCAPAATTRSRC